MTTFSYTTGNPSNLTAGATASMNDIQGPFTDLRTYINGANLDTGNLATSAKPVTLLGAYRTVSEATGRIPQSTAAGSYSFDTGGLLLADANIVSSSLSALCFPWDPADYAVSGLTPMVRLRWGVVTNGVNPALTLTAQLFTVVAAGGVGGFIGFDIAGPLASSNIALGPTSQAQAASSDIAAPAAGLLALGVTVPSTTPAGSNIAVSVALQVHHV